MSLVMSRWDGRRGFIWSPGVADDLTKNSADDEFVPLTPAKAGVQE
jgi:hypothetical protein